MVTINNYFDKVFYINLNKDKVRNNNILNQFKEYGITNYERVEGAILDDIPDKYYWRNFNVERLNKKYILGSLGVRNSHWRIMQISLDRGYNKIMVLEDDIVFKTNPNEILSNNIVDSKEWDMLYFGGMEEPHFGGQIVGAYAYAINRKLIEETFAMLPHSGMEVDNFYAKIIYHMSYNYNTLGRYIIKKINPFNSIVHDFSYPSNIQS